MANLIESLTTQWQKQLYSKGISETINYTFIR